MNRKSKLIYRIMLASKLHSRNKEISLDTLKQGCCLSDSELLTIIKELEIKKLIISGLLSLVGIISKSFIYLGGLKKWVIKNLFLRLADID